MAKLPRRGSKRKERPEPKTMQILSLGGGVQSTVMALRAERGELEGPVDAAIFADTDWEPDYVYSHIAWLSDQLSFPIYMVDRGRSLRHDVINHKNHSGKEGFIEIPIYLKGGGKIVDGKPVKDGIGRRQCTTNYKIVPIRRMVRSLLGLEPRQHVPVGTMVYMWLGISTDEASRVKDSREWWITNKYPLIYEKPMSRQRCIEWMEHFYPEITVRKSACVGCPYHSASTWVEIAENASEQFEQAIEIDEDLRKNPTKYRGEAFLHQSRRPLREAVAADKEKLAEAKRIADMQGELFTGTAGKMLFEDGFVDGCEEGYCGL